jgi:hypothetical protein
MTKLLYIALTAVILLFISYLPSHPVNWDEPWFYELSYWQSKIGYAKTQMWQVMNDPNTKQLVTHKLFIVLKSYFHTFNIASIFLYIKKAISKNAAIFSLICFFSISWTQLLGFTARPEFMMLSFCLLAFITTESYIKTSKKSHLVLAGVFAGLAVLTHLNAIATTASLFLIILLHSTRKIDSLIFGIIAGFVSLLYFHDIQSMADLQLFIQQFTHDPALTKTDKSIFAPIFKILNEHKRFFSHGEEASLTLLCLFSFITNYKELTKEHKLLIHFSVLNIFIFAAISRSTTPNYITMHYLFFLFVISFGFHKFFSKLSKPKLKYSFCFLFILFFLFNTGASFKYLQRRGFGHDTPEFLIQKLPKNAKPMISSNFVYDLIGKYTLTGERLGQMRHEGQPGFNVDFDIWYSVINERGLNTILLDKEYTLHSHHFIFGPSSIEKLKGLGWEIEFLSERYLYAVKH